MYDELRLTGLGRALIAVQLPSLDLQRGTDRSACGREYSGHFGLRKGKKALHHNGIELRATGEDKPANRLFKRQSFSVGPRGNHGVKRVDHRDDARNDGDFRFLQSGRIPLPVERLMVMQDVERRSLKSR